MNVIMWIVAEGEGEELQSELRDRRAEIMVESMGLLHTSGIGVSAHVGGGVDTNGNWGVEAGVEFRFRKRSVQSHYNITLKVDPCNFYTYDDDRDGTIVKKELHAIFGNNEKTNALFKDLDITPGDGYIAEEEFYAMAPVIIAECLDTDEW